MTDYRRSTRCSSGACVEVALDMPGVVHVRNSEDVAREPLRFTPEEWQAFVAGVKAGEFDL